MRFNSIEAFFSNICSSIDPQSVVFEDTICWLFFSGVEAKRRNAMNKLIANKPYRCTLSSTHGHFQGPIFAAKSHNNRW